jgi:hypothetical protein
MMGFFEQGELEQLRAQQEKERQAYIRKCNAEWKWKEDDCEEECEAWEDDEPEDTEDTEQKFITRAEVVLLWENIEHHRAAIACKLAIFENWLDISPALYNDWCEFTEIGGVTAYELRRFLDGQIIRRRPMRQRKHLRLVASKKGRAVRAPHGDNDAA